MKNGKTPLMSAALEAADETVSFLLSLGASADKTDADGHPVLMYAIQSKCFDTMNLLAPKTLMNLGGSLYWLAFFKVKLVTGELTQLVERAVQDREAAIEGLEAAAKYGSHAMLDMIAKHTQDYSIFEEDKQEVWMEAVKSDSAATVSTLLPLLPNPPLKAITLARERGVPGVIRLLLPDTKVEGEEERGALRDSVLANTAQLLDQIPRDVEFTYNQNMDKLRPLLQNDSLVPHTTLLKQLHLPKAHFDDMVCPSDCNRKGTLGWVPCHQHELWADGVA